MVNLIGGEALDMGNGPWPGGLYIVKRDTFYVSGDSAETATVVDKLGAP